MSSQNSISLASSRQFDVKHTQTRIELNKEQASSSMASAELEQVSEEQLDRVTLSLSAEQSIRVNLLNSLFGRKISIQTLDILAPAAPKDRVDPEPVELAETEDLEFVLTQSHYYEFEQTSFTAQGSLTLSNGTETEFNFSMSYSREFESYSESLIARRELKDPLVINFSDQPMSLVNDKFEFDLNMDGQKEQLSQLSSGSAFIALDKNNNGRIDDGSELFGAQTGDGFAELAQFDQDQNGVINKNDEIFDQLLVWSPGQNGTLMKLSETDVDTLVLQTVDTSYRFTDANNQTLGQMRQSSVYANTDGSVGGLHQIDLAV